MSKSFYKLEAYDDGKQPVVGRILDADGHEVDEPTANQHYLAELEYCGLKNDKHLAEALHGIQGRLVVSELLLPLFPGVQSADLQFKNLKTRKKYLLLIPRETVRVNRRMRKAKNRLGMEITEWDVEASSLNAYQGCFHELVLGWVVDDEFKSACELAKYRAFKFTSLTLF